MKTSEAVELMRDCLETDSCHLWNFSQEHYDALRALLELAEAVEWCVQHDITIDCGSGNKYRDVPPSFDLYESDTVNTREDRLLAGADWSLVEAVRKAKGEP